MGYLCEIINIKECGQSTVKTCSKLQQRVHGKNKKIFTQLRVVNSRTSMFIYS